MGSGRVLQCPVCASENVRVSFSRPFWEPIYRWQGLGRYRCRECRKAFHAPLLPGGRFASKAARHRSRKRADAGKEPQPVAPRRKKLFEGALFLILLIFFYVLLSATKL
jgi:hypothetical protein